MPNPPAADPEVVRRKVGEGLRPRPAFQRHLRGPLGDGLPLGLAEGQIAGDLGLRALDLGLQQVPRVVGGGLAGALRGGTLPQGVPAVRAKERPPHSQPSFPWQFHASTMNAGVPPSRTSPPHRLAL